MQLPIEQLPDRRFSRRRNLRFLLFMLLRPFMLLPGIAGWMCGWGFGGWALVRIAERSGHVDLAHAVFLAVLGPFLGLGASALLGLVPFLGWRRLRVSNVRWEAAAGDLILLEQSATHWMGPEPRRGMLSLTTREVVFLPDRFAVQRPMLRMELKAIEGVKWFRSPAPEGFQSTSTMVLSSSQGDEEFLFSHLDAATKAADCIADARAR